MTPGILSSGKFSGSSGCSWVFSSSVLGVAETSMQRENRSIDDPFFRRARLHNTQPFLGRIQRDGGEEEVYFEKRRKSLFVIHACSRTGESPRPSNLSAVWQVARRCSLSGRGVVSPLQTVGYLGLH